MAGARRVHSDRIQRVVRRVLAGAVAGFSVCHLNLVVADSARRILRRRLHRVSLWTMRRARPVADAAPAGAFDRSSIALRIGGAGVASGCDRRFGAGSGIRRSTLIISLVLHLLMLLGEVAMPHTTDNARYGARLMTHGPFARAFWGGAVVRGRNCSAAAFVASDRGAGSHGSRSGERAGLAGLLIFEWCFVMAGQSVPNS